MAKKHITMKKIILAFLITFSVSAQIKLPRLISDGMILQRDTKVNIWGWASPNENIELDFKGKKYNATTSEEGKWSIQLPSQKAGGPMK